MNKDTCNVIARTVKGRGRIDIIGFSNPDDVYEGNYIDSVKITLIESTESPDIYYPNNSASYIQKFVEVMPFSIEQMKVSNDVIYDFELKVAQDANTCSTICEIISINVQKEELLKLTKTEDIKEFKIPVSYEKCGFIHILGTSLENAIERAEKQEEYIPCPTYDEYLDGSYSINSDCAEFYNKED